MSTSIAYSGPKYSIGKGSTSTVYLDHMKGGTVYVRKPYDDERIVDEPVYRLSEQEQLIELKWQFQQTGHPLGKLFEVEGEDQLMRYKGPTLEELGFFDENTLAVLGSYVATMCQDLQDIGIAMPDWKPANVCAAPVIKLMYCDVYRDGNFAEMERAIVKCTEQIRAIIGAEADEFQEQIVSVESCRPSFTNDVEFTIIFQHAATADIFTDRNRFETLQLNGRSPVIQAGTEYTVIDFNAMYVMDKANCAQKNFRPARGTFCPYGADYEQLHQSREVMVYGMWFAAACLMAWARLRFFEETHKVDSIIDRFVLLASRANKSRRPTTRAEFLEQHAVIAAANEFVGGIKMPDPNPVANFLEEHYILRAVSPQ